MNFSQFTFGAASLSGIRATPTAKSIVFNALQSRMLTVEIDPFSMLIVKHNDTVLNKIYFYLKINNRLFIYLNTLKFYFVNKKIPL